MKTKFFVSNKILWEKKHDWLIGNINNDSSSYPSDFDWNDAGLLYGVFITSKSLGALKIHTHKKERKKSNMLGTRHNDNITYLAIRSIS